MDATGLSREKGTVTFSLLLACTILVIFFWSVFPADSGLIQLPGKWFPNGNRRHPESPGGLPLLDRYQNEGGTE